MHRYYLSRFNVSLPSIPQADEILSILEQDARFEAHRQSDLSTPRADDIIVFGDNAKTPVGHVAVAKTDPIPVGCSSLVCGPQEDFVIPIIEQNSYLTHTLSLRGDPLSGFNIIGRLGLEGSTAPVIGWARLRSNGYSTFGANQSFSTSGLIIGSFVSNVVGLQPPPAQQTIAEAFVLSQPLTLDAIQIAIEYFAGPNQLVVYIAAGDRAPGPPIESFQFTNVPRAATILTGTSTSHPRLMPGVVYWLVATTPDLVHSYFSWQFSPLEIPTEQASNTANGPWTVAPSVGPER